MVERTSRRRLVTVTPDCQTWHTVVRFPDDGEVWTRRRGWHPSLRAPLATLLKTARESARRKGHVLIAPPIPPAMFTFQIRRGSVRALVDYNIRYGTLVCSLDTMEAIPRA